jgi:hypothetical protein
MKNRKLVALMAMAVAMQFAVVGAQDFRIGWYSPDDHTYQPNPRFGCVDGSPTGSFTSIGINTLLAYKQGIYQVYNGNSWPINLSTLITNTTSYLNLYPSQKIILDISAGQDDNPIFRSSGDVQTYVNTFKNDTRVIGWYIADEPEGDWANDPPQVTYYRRDALVSRYNYIKSLSGKNIFVSVANTGVFRTKYGDGTLGADGLPRVAKFYDILMADHYPVQIGAPSNSITGCRIHAQYTKALVENDANTSSNVFYFVSQGQGYNQDNNNGSNGIFNMDDPTMPQLKYMVISPMIWGAKGILFWSYACASRRGNDSPTGYPVDSWRTVHRFTQWFKAGSFHGSLGNIYGTSPETTAPNEEGGIHYRTKTYSSTPAYKEYYIFSVNESQNQCSGFVTVPSAPAGWTIQAYENQYNSNNPGQTFDVARSISNSRISLTWVGFEVKIFRIIYRAVAKASSNVGDNPEEAEAIAPAEYRLHNNFPNPFNPTTHVRYDLPENSRVCLQIYTTMGVRVKDLVNGTQSAGAYSLLWDGRDDAGRQLPSGTYILKITANQYSGSIKLIMMK